MQGKRDFPKKRAGASAGRYGGQAPLPGDMVSISVQSDGKEKEGSGNYLDSCSFTSCSHTCEKGCAVLKAVAEGKIAPSRHANYVAMYNEVKNIKEWEKK